MIATEPDGPTSMSRAMSKRRIGEIEHLGNVAQICEYGIVVEQLLVAF